MAWTVGDVILFFVVAAVVVGPAPCAAQTGPESTALTAMLNAIPGLQVLGWIEGDVANACSQPWTGLTCSGGSVIEIILDSRGLVGFIPDAIGGLTSLKKLVMNANAIWGPLPPTFCQLTQLQFVNFRDNHDMTGNIPDCIGDLTQIIELILNVNKFTGTIPATLAGLTQLQLLHLSDNQLSGTIPPELGDLVTLKQLWLHVNQLNGTIPDRLSLLTSADWISVSGNIGITGYVPLSFQAMSQLRTLWLHNTGLSGCFFEPPALTQCLMEPALCACNRISCPYSCATCVNCGIDPPVPPPPQNPPVNPPVDPPVNAPQNAPANAPMAAPVNAPDPPVNVPQNAPANAPVAAPVNVPVNPPVNPPVDPPLNSPVDAPVNAPIAPPSALAAPVSAPINAPEEAPLSAPETTPSDQMSQAPVESPVDAPIEPPLGVPIEAPLAAAAAPISIPPSMVQVITCSSGTCIGPVILGGGGGGDGSSSNNTELTIASQTMIQGNLIAQSSNVTINIVVPSGTSAADTPLIITGCVTFNGKLNISVNENRPLQSSDSVTLATFAGGYCGGEKTQFSEIGVDLGCRSAVNRELQYQPNSLNLLLGGVDSADCGATSSSPSTASSSSTIVIAVVIPVVVLIAIILILIVVFRRKIIPAYRFEKGKDKLKVGFSDPHNA